MQISSWTFTQDTLESALHRAYNVCLDTLLEDGVIDEAQLKEGYCYAPKILMPNSVVGWLKDKIFPPKDKDKGWEDGSCRHICVKLYSEKLQETEDVEEEVISEVDCCGGNCECEDESDKSETLGVL